jgi:predicted hydrolase (HD superfamily)
LIMALAKVRPGNFEGMSAKSIRKVMKKKDFAAAVNRNEIKQGMSELGINSVDEENGHFEFVIGALSEKKLELGF